MNILVNEFKTEIDALVDLMVSSEWEFHATRKSNPERLIAAYHNGYFTGEGIKTFWIKTTDDKNIGLIRLYDLDDGTPLFDLRLRKEYQGNGVGTKALKWLTDYVFTEIEDIDRIEANTRQDNYAMRKVFLKGGYAKEAHFRKAWVCNNGDVFDAIGYGITKEDWKNDTVTPVVWEDFK